MPAKSFIKLAACGILLFVVTGVSTAQSTSPKTVRDFFDLIPSAYFSIYCCDGNKKAYVEKYVTVIDIQNGFMEGSDTEEDPKYQGFVLKVFPARNGKTVVGLFSESLHWWDYYFLEYKNGKLVNISKTIPRYSRDNYYEFPRAGAAIKVYKKKYSSPTKEINADETVDRGKYLYSLIWKDGKFSVTK